MMKIGNDLCAKYCPLLLDLMLSYIQENVENKTLGEEKMPQNRV